MNKQKKYYYTKKGLTAHTYKNQKTHSRDRGHRPPEYTAEEFREWLYSQERFHVMYNEWANSGYKKRLKPSVDRLNDNVHYCFGNIQLITWGENYDKGTRSRHKKVDQFTKDGKVIRRWDSIKEATEAVGASRTTISEAIRGNYKTAKGFVWRYSNED